MKGKTRKRTLHVIIDTREQLPFPFAFDKYPAQIKRGTLKTGDYSLAGLEHCVAIERKSLDDLIGCLIMGRDRFERELDRARSLECFAVVIEASLEDVSRHRYSSRMDPHAALQSILAFQVRYRCPFVWAGTRAGAEYATYWTLEKYQREQEERDLEAKAVAELESLSERWNAPKLGDPKKVRETSHA